MTLNQVFEHDRDVLRRLFLNPPGGGMSPDGWRGYVLHLFERLTKLKRAIAENPMSARDLDAAKVGLAVERARRRKGVYRPRPRYGSNPVTSRLIMFSQFPDVLDVYESRNRRTEVSPPQARPGAVLDTARGRR